MRIPMKSKAALIAILIGIPLSGIACSGSGEALIEHPNVLFIALDDMNDWVEPLGGHPMSLTPQLDRFAQTGVHFKRNYTPSPGCNPSRSATMTGLHPISSGMYSNYQDWREVPVLQQVKTMGQHFREGGYYTAGAGKIFHYSQVDSTGWDDYFPSISSPMPQEYLPDDRPLNMTSFPYMYNMFDWAPLELKDEETADYQTVSYISDQLQQDHNKPFFLAAGIYRPHLPWYVPQEYFDRFPLEDIQKPAILADDVEDLGPVAKELIERGGNYHKHVVEAGQWEEAIQGYLASIAYADAMLGRILDALEASPHADNTIVVIWSDHGWQLGEKEHWRKFALWENVIRTVFMMRVPNGVAALPGGSAKGVSTENLTSLLDIYPTLAELCRLSPRQDYDGQSLTGMLANPTTPVPRPIISTYDYGSYSVRFENWHFIRYIDGSEELYNLTEDPEEWHNLAQEGDLEDTRLMLADFIPENPIDLPEESLIPLMEHHVPPFRSEEYFFSEEREIWMQRFESAGSTQ